MTVRFPGVPDTLSDSERVVKFREGVSNHEFVRLNDEVPLCSTVNLDKDFDCESSRCDTVTLALWVFPVSVKLEVFVSVSRNVRKLVVLDGVNVVVLEGDESKVVDHVKLAVIGRGIVLEVLV